MKEYIEKDALAADGWYLQRHINGDGYACVESMNILDIPAADVVERRHGRWVLFDNAMSMWNVWVCSECGYRRKEGWMHTEAGEKPNALYCENCMAKMDGSVNDGRD